MKGAWRSPRTRPCLLQFSAQLLQHELEGVFPPSQPSSTPPPAQLQGTSLEMLSELLEIKLDPESSRQWELVMGKSTENGMGWDLESPRGEERGLHRI